MLAKISESINGNMQYMIILVLAVIAALIVTFVMNIVGKRKKFLRYIPGLALVFIGMFSLIIVLNRLFDRSNLMNIYVALVCVTAGFCSLLFALCIGIYNKDRHPQMTNIDERRRREEMESAGR
ncbi:MAG: cytochrome C biosynthesis protein [Peptoniphilus sp.]|nr:cytochrome C biosynthesis protein [Peptoniphilus sp.]MDD7363757.1 cytochrome C biosynthesis protein [Bacillota bacterium]MDY6044142.1 cytochrome C biosynthesis protein [Peptoniphilus sp.]